MTTAERLYQLNHRLAPLIKIFREAGLPVYPVGGCVRDALMGREGGDMDLATPALPETVKTLFRRVIDTGIKHGTVTVILGNQQFEVTTFRADTVYSDGRRPDSVIFGASLLEDLARRDFTVNAAAWDPQENRLIDPFGAEEDCRRKILRAVGIPRDRFSEDALRIFRLFRFQSQLGFSIDPATLQAAFETSDKTRLLSSERVRTEWEKLLVGANWLQARNLAMQAGLLPGHGAPGCQKADPLLLVETPPLPETRWAWHFLDSGHTTASSVREKLLSLKSSRKDLEAILRTWRVFDLARRDHRDPEAYLDAWGQRDNLIWMDWLPVFFHPAEAEMLKRAVKRRAFSKIPLKLSEIPIKGDDLQNLGFSPGPILGLGLQWLLAWTRLEGKVLDRDDFLKEAVRLLQHLPK